MLDDPVNFQLNFYFGHVDKAFAAQMEKEVPRMMQDVCSNNKFLRFVDDSEGPRILTEGGVDIRPPDTFDRSPFVFKPHRNSDPLSAKEARRLRFMLDRSFSRELYYENESTISLVC